MALRLYLALFVSFLSLGIFATPATSEIVGWQYKYQNLQSPILTASEDGGQRRRLRGRFLHITDVHPDPFYIVHSSTEGTAACHRGSGPAGFYGAETSDCDSPISLLNATFAWINATIKDEIDFVIWTGDSARHDNDEHIPRSDRQITDLNELLVSKFVEVFGKPDDLNDPDPLNDFIIPIVPTFGNNDIFPHNTFSDGPNKWTRRYLDIWRQFIPEEQRHQFARGGWFSVEVIPGKLAVISLNTLYFFTSNPAVDGCAMRSEPGYEHMEWLRIQLEIMRLRGMKAIITGHVPPARVDAKTSWDETCWQKYTLWMQSYRDVVVASMYGHMNIDHFMIQDSQDVRREVRRGYMTDDSNAQARRNKEGLEVGLLGVADYLNGLRSVFADLPNAVRALDTNAPGIVDNHKDSPTGFLHDEFGLNQAKSADKGKKRKKPKGPLSPIGGPFAERYSMSFVSPSVVPNFHPSIRVFTYNITGLEKSANTKMGAVTQRDKQLLSRPTKVDGVEDDQVPDEHGAKKFGQRRKGRGNKGSRKKPRRHKFIVPNPPSRSAPPGPAYSPQTLSLLSYTQYYANLTVLNNDFHNDTQSEEVHTEADSLNLDTRRWKSGKHHGKTKKGKPHPKKFKFVVEYDTKKDRMYGLQDLTVKNYLKLAKKMSIIGSSSIDTVEDDNEDGSDASYGVDDVLESRDGDGFEGADVVTAENSPDDLYMGDNDNGDVDSDEKEFEGNEGTLRGRKHKAKRMNKTWFTFVKRAFVGSLDAADIHDQFGPKQLSGDHGRNKALPV